jgi:PAS domain S-box-containing protein
MKKTIHMLTGHTQSPSEAKQILFTTDIEGNFRFVNGAAKDLTGYSCEELQALTVFHLLPNTPRQEFSRNVRRALRRRFGMVFEIAITTRSGQQLVLETSLAVQRQPDRSREFRGVAIEVRDVRPLARCVDPEFQSGGSLRRCVLAKDSLAYSNGESPAPPETLDHSDLSFFEAK